MMFVSVMLLLAFARWTDAQTKQQPKQQPPSGTTSVAKKVQLIDLNSATKDELKTLPGVDDATAQKIIDNRPYRNKTQLVSKKVVSQDAYGKFSAQVIAKQTKKKER